MTVHLQYKKGVNWRVERKNYISISKAPGALIRKNMVCDLPLEQPTDRQNEEKLVESRSTQLKSI